MIRFLLAIILAAPGKAAWMNVKVDTMDRRVMCAAHGIIDSEPMLVLCGENGLLYFYRWTGTELRRETLDAGSSYPNAAVFADLRGDGVQRLYVGSSLNKGIIEFSPDGAGGYKRHKFRVPAQAVFMAATYSQVEMKSLLVLKSWEMFPVKDNPKMAWQQWTTHVCGIDGEGFLDCKMIGEDSDAPFFLVSKPGVDILMSDPRHSRERGGDWTTINGLYDEARRAKIAEKKKEGSLQAHWIQDISVRRNLVRSLTHENIFYTDKAEFRVDDMYRQVISSHPIDGGLSNTYSGVAYGAHAMPNAGSLRAILPHRLKPGIQERLLITKMDDRLYEFTRLRNAWQKTEEIAWYPLGPDYLLTADMRGDGRRRVYLVGNGPVSNRSESALWELDYFPRKLTVAVLNFAVAGGEAWKAGAQDMLGDLLRTELAKAQHLVVIDEEKQEGILAERALRAATCEGDECLAELGKLLEAEVVVKSELSQKPGGLVLTTRAVTSAGRVLFKFERSGIPLSEALNSVRSAGKSWNQLLSSAAIEPVK